MVKKEIKKDDLTNEELIGLYQIETDEVKKKRIADKLYKKNFRLVAKNAGVMPTSCKDLQDDLIQEASLLFMKCLNKFDTSKNFKFSTYFSNACRYELPRFKKKQNKHVDNSYYIEIDEILTAKPDNIEEKIDDIEGLKKIKETLVKLTKENVITLKQFDAIIKEHGFFGCNQMTRKEMAHERNCSLQNIGFLYRKGISKIREKLYTEEE